MTPAHRRRCRRAASAPDEAEDPRDAFETQSCPDSSDTLGTCVPEGRPCPPELVDLSVSLDTLDAVRQEIVEQEEGSDGVLGAGLSSSSLLIKLLWLLSINDRQSLSVECRSVMGQ